MSRVAQEAARWLLRLQENPDDDSLRTRFESWLLSHPQHAAEFSRFDTLWQQFDNQHWLADMADKARRQQRRRTVKGVLACSLAAVLGIGSWHWQQQRPRWEISLNSRHQPMRQSLPDGSSIVLQAASQLAVRYSASQREVVLRRGEALFDIARDTDRPFSVHTPLGNVTVLGTRFSLRLTEARLLLAVAHGKVRLDDSSSRHVATLRAGEHIWLDAAGRHSDEALQRDPFSWADGTLVFHDATAAEVLRSLAPYQRHDLRSSGLDHLRLNAVVQLDDVPRFLQRLPEVWPVRWQQAEREWLLLARE